jgi:hypothetical protein
MASTDDLVDWLRLQLDEDERDGSERHAFGCSAFDPVYEDSPRDAPLTDANACSCRVARVLREVQAKRRIVEVAVSRHKASVVLPAGHREASAAAALAVLQFLAFPYSDRPGFREEWHE